MNLKDLSIELKTRGHKYNAVRSNFMARPNSFYHPMSRDFGMGSIPCDLKSCICNKNGKCEVPSRVHISVQGKCKGFQVAEKDFEF